MDKEEVYVCGERGEYCSMMKVIKVFCYVKPTFEQLSLEERVV